MAFHLLAEPIRRYVRDQRWEELRPIQAAAIQHILADDDNYILASRTASGKTEAAFLPILSKVDFRQPGVRVLYVSPLIALINDQFQRVETLCQYLDVPVTKWHGEASRTEKKKLLDQPAGILLITPESLEAMFVHAPRSVKTLFSQLDYVVIDEIHSFLGTDRGLQLQSLLARLRRAGRARFAVVGLSATIGDYAEAKRFTGEAARTKVLLDRAGKEMHTQFRYFPADRSGADLPLDLLKDLYKQTSRSKALIFPNTRGLAEVVAVKLRLISDRVHGHANYFSHHSSVHKEVREYVEHFAKHNQRQPFCIACTSTLELGIDIGSVDKVVQIDAAQSVASLIQRVGRSGRRDGAASELLLYATNPWSLVQSLACWLLYQDGFVEPLRAARHPYDLLLHQALSIVKERAGIGRAALLKELLANAAFTEIAPAAANEILDELLRIDWLEALGGELIIGVEGEFTVNSREFFSVFKTEPVFKVVHAGKTVGEIPYSLQVQEQENLFLAARTWKITGIDGATKRIEVVPARDGKRPIFSGGGGTVHPRIREKMLEILVSPDDYPELDELSQLALRSLRQQFAGRVWPAQLTHERPALVKDKGLIFYTFTGTKINRSLAFLLRQLEVDFVFDDSQSSFGLAVAVHLLPALFEQLRLFAEDVDFHLRDALARNPALIDFAKWGTKLPEHLQVAVLKERYFDFAGAADFLRNTVVV
ncbi:DEAD/DEAH box helicase [Hymenobacter siberiensis]|jgi:ATP-dependent Lhr-like helicase|uniref:DEAD/DEAH box helicase n=1 Tax=Hymenobacter siberiensis TaxID=2848396 RepID=UPI001C1DD07D|nr:DEAD/DEAH box helicase [Hymenobacter siberiensis]MBU6120848.1 DEAD/DEAH box helicase [Hymenobacter siberiensis]